QSKAVRDILADIFDPGERTSLAVKLLRLFDTSERESCRASRGIGIHAARLVRLLHQRKVRVDFMRKIVLWTTDAKRIQQSFQESPHIYSAGLCPSDSPTRSLASRFAG